VTPLAWVAFVGAGAVGAPLRYLVDTAVQARVRGQFPWGTLVVNATGSLVLGFIVGLATYHAFPNAPKVVLGAGFCGSYTTFSTYAFETVRLAEEGEARLAVVNALGTLVAGAGAAALGLALAAM
jgi:CrcB protein